MSTRRSLWQQRLLLVLSYHAPVLLAMGVALLIPLLVAIWEARGLPSWTEARGYLLPALVSFFLGLTIRIRRPAISSLTQHEALLVTTAVWLTIGVLGAAPFTLILGTLPIDSLLESVSGFTTAGTTMLVGLDSLPRSVLVWRMLTQWLGGMGILLIVLLVGQSRGSQTYSLLSAEGVKVSSGRLSLNFRHAAIRFTIIYLLLTFSQTIITTLLGMPLFDSLHHAMTTVSTGGFSPHDESIAFYRNRPLLYPRFVAIELVIVLFMLAGGINFYVLYRLGRGQLAALWDGLEMRILWLVVIGATLSVTISSWLIHNGSLSDWLLRSLFEVASLVSTTGYETTATGSFPRLAKEIFLLLMIIGGCAGSTAGGIKLIRVGMLTKILAHENRRLRLPVHAVDVPQIDGQPIGDDVFRSAAFVIFLWLGYLAAGGWMVSLMAPHLAIADAYSTVFSAIGVFGPSFIPVADVIALPGAAKLIFIIGMLAGRLEILPLLVFFNPTAWRR